MSEDPTHESGTIKWPCDAVRGNPDGFELAHEGDGLVMSRPSSSGKTVQDQIAPTIKTNQNSGVVVRDDPIMWPSLNGSTEVKEGDGVVPSRPYSTRKSVMDGISFGIAATATPAVAVKDGEREDSSEDLPDIPDGGVAPMLTPGREVKRQNGRRFKEDGEESFTITAVDKHGVATREEGKLRIRYLTPRECFRLMGFTDNEIDSIMAVETSKSRLYKMAGNSIVVDVLAAIFHNIYVEPTFERAKVTSLDHFFKVI